MAITGDYRYSYGMLIFISILQLYLLSLILVSTCQIEKSIALHDITLVSASD